MSSGIHMIASTQRFPSRASLCDEVINVIHVTCQRFYCCVMMMIGVYDHND